MICPVGSIIAYHENFFTVIPTLPNNWRKCNGSVVVDVDSPFNGKTLPNLNIAAGSITVGKTTSGTLTANNVRSGMGFSSFGILWIIRIK